MKKVYLIGKMALVCLLLAVSNNSCTNLDEQLYSAVEEKNFYKTDEEFTAALGAAYTSLYGFMNHGALFSISEVSSDEVVIPHRGNDWFDGGQWLRMHRHEYKANEDGFNNAWGFCFGGVSNCNRLLEQLAAADAVKAAAFTSELKVLRALFYYWLLDLYGNVPIVTAFKNAEAAPATKTRAEVYAFVEKELAENVPKLSKSVDKSTYARMNFYVGQAILAKLYLNAGVYTGTPQYAKAQAAADEVISSGKYRLESDYGANFKFNNETSVENMFVVPYDKVNAQGFNLVTWTKWTGYDPEFINLGSGNNGIIPQSKSYTFGVQVGF